MFTRIWAVAALNRALRTLAQTAVALIGTTAVIEGVDWQIVASGAGLAAILSLLTSLAGLPEAEVPAPAGPVVSNMYIVGEGEPELFIPRHRLEQVADEQSAGNDHSGFPYA